MFFFYAAMIPYNCMVNGNGSSMLSCLFRFRWIKDSKASMMFDLSLPNQLRTRIRASTHPCHFDKHSVRSSYPAHGPVSIPSPNNTLIQLSPLRYLRRLRLFILCIEDFARGGSRRHLGRARQQRLPLPDCCPARPLMQPAVSAT
jgi:hypothetical protein